MTKRELLIGHYSDQLLDIIDHVDEFDRGDLQGAIEAQLSMLINDTKENL